VINLRKRQRTDRLAGVTSRLSSMQPPRIITLPAVCSVRRPVDALRQVARYAAPARVHPMLVIARNALSQNDPIKNSRPFSLPAGASFTGEKGSTLRLLTLCHTVFLPLSSAWI
jgi:hypothetical protein